jgi:HAE1 family hydrophobic/amphiphilic exporter-1
MDMNFAAMNVREKIDLVKENLPKEALEPVVLKYNPTQVEAIMLSVSYINGEEKEILVEIDKGRSLANQVSIIDVITALANVNITYPVGTIKEEKCEYLVKTVGEFQDIDDVSALSFSKADYNASRAMSTKKVKNQTQEADDKIIFLQDIANIKETLKDGSGYSRYNSSENISVGVYQQSGSNLLNLSKEVQKNLRVLETKFQIM